MPSIALGLLLLLSIISQQFILNYFETQVANGMQLRAAEIADGLINGMNMLMVTGKIQDPENRKLLVHKMGNSKGVTELRIIRAKPVQDQFGLGLPSEQATDELDQKAIETKTPVFLTIKSDGGEHQFRAVIPFIASTNFRGTNCLSCHHAKAGSVIGAVSMVFDMKNDEARVEQIKRWVWTGDFTFAMMLSVIIIWRRAEEQRNRLLRELRELNSKIEAASTAKSQFLSNMSHEFRTPLNAIIGFTEVLQDKIPGPLNADQLEYLGDIHDGGQLLLRLINDVLDLSKVEAGRLELFYETFSIAQMVRESITTLRGLAEKKGLSIQLNLPPDLGLITADQIRFKQVLYNLLSNAVKFTDKGEITVSAMIENQQLHLTVTDTGIGIRSEDMDRIFVEFSQVDASNSSRHEGTGLGLALSKRLVEVHGGRIWVESTFGVGSTFHVVLPLRPDGSGEPGESRKNNSP